jgi:hypothetical protein
LKLVLCPVFLLPVSAGCRKVFGTTSRIKSGGQECPPHTFHLPAVTLST